MEPHLEKTDVRSSDPDPTPVPDPVYLQLGLMCFCPPTSHTVRDVFLSRFSIPTLKPMVGDVSITWKVTETQSDLDTTCPTLSAHLRRKLTCPVRSLASRVDFPAESRPMRITWAQVRNIKVKKS